MSGNADMATKVKSKLAGRMRVRMVTDFGQYDRRDAARKHRNGKWPKDAYKRRQFKAGKMYDVPEDVGRVLVTLGRARQIGDT